MDIQKIIDFLNHSETRSGSKSYQRIINNFEIQPSDFLKFSEIDLSAQYGHNLINALSNAKRALDSQIDTLLIGFDFYKVAKNKMWGFPKKIDLIKQLGIIAPRVLNKINKTRNLMEHEFIKPDRQVVEDFVDIVSLFIACTDRYIYELPSDCEFINEELIEFFLRMDLDLSQHTLALGIVVDSGEIINRSYTNSDREYVDLLKGYLKVGTSYWLQSAANTI